MQVQHSQVLPHLSNAPPIELGSSWSLLDRQDVQQMLLLVRAAAFHLLQSVQKSKPKPISQSKGRRLANEKQRKRQHRVSFCIDQDNCVLTKTSPNDSPAKLTDAECQSLWWSPKELLHIRQSALVICHYLMESEQDYCRALAILVGICARSDTTQSSLPAANHVLLTSAHYETARCFTDLISPTLPIRRRRSVQLVLQAQADMVDQVQCDRMLAAKYQYWSRYATAWARVLAEQDAACCCE
jgi:hypothetical protein